MISIVYARIYVCARECVMRDMCIVYAERDICIDISISYINKSDQFFDFQFLVLSKLV